MLSEDIQYILNGGRASAFRCSALNSSALRSSARDMARPRIARHSEPEPESPLKPTEKKTVHNRLIPEFRRWQVCGNPGWGIPQSRGPHTGHWAARCRCPWG